MILSDEVIVTEVIDIDLPGLPVQIPNMSSLERDPLTVCKIKFSQISGATFHIVPVTPEVNAYFEKKYKVTVDRSFTDLPEDDEAREIRIDAIMELIPFWEGFKSYDGSEIEYSRENVIKMFWKIPRHMFGEYMIAASYSGVGLIARLEAENLKKSRNISTEEMGKKLTLMTSCETEEPLKEDDKTESQDQRSV